VTGFPNDPNIPHQKPCRFCDTTLVNRNAHCMNPACDWCDACVKAKHARDRTT
jgi:hypothetical protein